MSERLTKVLRLAAIPLLSLSGQVAAQEPPAQDLETVAVNLTSDTSVLSLFATKNYGSSKSLDANRSLVTLTEDDLRSVVGGLDYIASAKLRFTLVPSLLPRIKRTISAHRVLKPWTELGATWGCAVDSNTSNLKSDCSGASAWNMSSPVDAFIETASGSAVLPSLRFGTIEIDVTENVQQMHRHLFTNYGWLLKTDLPDLTLLSDLASRESGTPPQLIMTVRHCSHTVCDDHNICTADVCSDQGFCQQLNSPPVECDDNNACTVQDTCGHHVCTGTPAPVGAACGSGLVCDGAGECIESVP